MKKEIFESLARLSPDTSPISATRQQSPTADISGELAFCLNTLMNDVGKKINQSPSTVLEGILHAGIDHWVGQLSDQTKKTLGLAHEVSAASNRRVEYDFDDENDPDPAHAQQAAYAQMTESYGYTPLTAHSVGASGNGHNGRKDSRNGGTNGRKNGKSKKVRAAGKKHPPKRSNSHKRKFSSPKQHSTAQ